MPAPFGPPGGGMPPQQQKKKQLPPKLFGGWTATLDDPESYQSRTIDRAETRLGGEEAIDETQPKEIFKGLNASEQMRRARKLQQMNAMGGMPVRESRKPRPGSNRWWNNINEKATNNPEIGKFFSEQIDKVLVNELRDSDLQGPGPIGSMTLKTRKKTRRPTIRPYDPNQGLSGLDDDLVPTYFDRPPPQHPSGDPIPIRFTLPAGPGSGQVTYIFENGDTLVVFGDERPDIFAPGDSFTTNDPDLDDRIRQAVPDPLKPFVPGGNPIEDLIHDFSDDG